MKICFKSQISYIGLFSRKKKKIIINFIKMKELMRKEEKEFIYMYVRIDEARMWFIVDIRS